MCFRAVSTEYPKSDPSYAESSHTHRFKRPDHNILVCRPVIKGYRTAILKLCSDR
jgi:hypothetical protein